jgi:hypothetical protein
MGCTVIADAAFAQVRLMFWLLQHVAFFIGNLKGCHAHSPKQDIKDECADKVGSVYTMVAAVKKGGEVYHMMATGWRATTKMVCVYLHSGGTNRQSTKRKKEKIQYMEDGSVQSVKCDVERPQCSAEYQNKMGAIDNHNCHRQSNKGTQSLESVCVTKGDDAPVIRVFIGAVALIAVNVWLATKHFYPEGLVDDKGGK